MQMSAEYASCTRFIFAIAAALAITSSPGNTVRADDTISIEGRGIAGLSQVAVPAIVNQLLPVMVDHLGADKARLQNAQSLKARVDASKVPGIATWYTGIDRMVFTHPTGFTPAGQLALAWLKDGRYHGRDRFTKIHQEIAKTQFPSGSPSTIDWSKVKLSGPSLAAAWEEARKSKRPMVTLAQTLAEHDGAMRTAAKRYVELVAGKGAVRAELEIRIAEALIAMAASVRPIPRTKAILKTRKRYLSPDVLWKNATIPVATPEDAAKVLEAASKGRDALATLLAAQLPPYRQYTRLIEATKRYENICAKGPWPKVVVPSRKKRRRKAWMTPENIRVIQTRLQLEGFFTGEPSGVWDDATKAALTAYQRLRHLKPKGRYTRKTAKNLNVPCTRRLKVLALNVKRWRHSALNVSQFHVFVNLPAFTGRYVVDGKTLATRRVVVGSGRNYWSPKVKRRVYKNATPILSDLITSIIMNPTWTVPKRIVLNELQPKIDRDPEFLAKNGYVVKTTSSGRELIVQQPGKKNALGDVKFFFPNAESIYMHDTPRKGVFNYPRRDYSHGCVRVHEAVKFAGVMLREDYRFRKKHYPGGMKSIAKHNRTTRFKLHNPVPVHLEYYTASVSDGGEIIFHPDIYDYDETTLVGPIGRRRPRH